MAVTRNRLIVWKINQIYSDVIAFVVSLVYVRMYKNLLKTNDFKNKKCPGEGDYINKWKSLGKVNPIYYRLYSHYVGNDPNIVPENILHNLIEPVLTPPVYRHFLSDKNLFDRLFPEGVMPKTLLRCMGGFYYDKNYNPVKDNHVLANILSDKIVVKPTIDTSGGMGVTIFVKQDNNYHELNNYEFVLTEDWLRCEYQGNFIIQECIEQSGKIAIFNPSSVNTIRIGVYRSVKNDEYIILDSLLRVGKSGCYVDNAHSGGVAIGIEKSGKLKHIAITREDTVLSNINGVDLSKDFFIPNYDKVINFAKFVCKQIPYLRLLTLDIMLDKSDNPHLIEFNCTSYSEDIFQPNATLFREYTDEIIDYVCKHKNERCRIFVK